MKYIDGKPELGIQIDWKKVEKRYNDLKCPDGLYIPPFRTIFENPDCKYWQFLSIRSTGKTTAWLLVGLILYDEYGVVTQYIRQFEDMLAPSHAQKLVDVILKYKQGYYIDRIFSGRYNSLKYYWRGFYLQKLDEGGKEVDRDREACIKCLSIDNNAKYKSTYNAPTGDLIIFDEFIGKYYHANEFVEFCDLLKTIIRDRISPIVIMLANNINLQSLYFEEFQISREVRGLKFGDERLVATRQGTKVFVSLLDGKKRKKEKDKNTSLFFSFGNPKLASITGSDLWAFDNVPHIPVGENEILAKNLYIQANAIDLLRVDIAYNDNVGKHLQVHYATKTHDDSIILTLSDIKERRERYALGGNKIRKLFFDMQSKNKIYFSSNEVGACFYDYWERSQSS